MKRFTFPPAFIASLFRSFVLSDVMVLSVIETWAQVPVGITPLAAQQSKFLGSVYSATQSPNLTGYFNQITPENAGKWGVVENKRDVMNWTVLDAAYALAKNHHLPFKMHTLVWGSQQPSWIEGLSAPEQLEEIKEWFSLLAARYPDIDLIDVVNEPLHAPPSGSNHGNYLKALGGVGVSGWDWVLESFRLARTYFPGAKLLINEYGVTNSSGSCARYLRLIEDLKARQLIDGIGIQAHAFETTVSAAITTTNLQRLATAGLPIYISELDIDGPTDEIQLAEYQRIFPIFWENPMVAGITLWGYRPGLWRTSQGAALVRADDSEKPALRWLRAYLSNAPPVVAPAQQFEISETAADGARVGVVVVTSEGGFGPLANWKITGGTGFGYFLINASTGELFVANGALFNADRQPSYTLIVTVTDGRNTSVAQTLTVNIVPASTPIVSPNQLFEIPCVAAEGAEVGRAAVTDPTMLSLLGSWQITGGTGSAHFVINPATGLITVATGAVYSRTVTTHYTLVVTVSDGRRTSGQQTLTVVVHADAPPIVTPRADPEPDIDVTPPVVTAPVVSAGQQFQIGDTASEGDNVGTVLGSDFDGAAALSNWQIVGGTGVGYFAIDRGTGQLTVARAAVLDGASKPRLTLSVTASDGQSTSAPEIVEINVRVVKIPPARLVNITARTYCGAGDNVTIGGFVVSGNSPKRVLVRAVGPTLATVGLLRSEILEDPMIKVHDASRGNGVIATNDNWGDNPNVEEIVSVAEVAGAAALSPDDTTSSAMLLTLAPGVYSFIVTGRTGGRGVVLTEVYDADPVPGGSSFINIATRADAVTGNGVAIGGFVISGGKPKRVFLRALGPTLVASGLSEKDVLLDPSIELHDSLHGNVVIATNDDWKDGPSAVDMIATTAKIGATPFSANDSKSAALLLSLEPGVYSFVARGKNDTTGIVLVELYDAD